ncbi:kinase-like domain-containing protein [Mycotypha africana]|uniref:kinase-like domain-containing protein n=1 Tax=Mycotypha africana TaxID=64632 RepID=UPI00230053D1|nr:kinase-like domain-containing protein [Mycotypha africana]KAI8991401.1 kinase-like domain-containing protein [Mycotypha africana]
MPLLPSSYQPSNLLTPERSVPSSPNLSPAVVTHTNATTKHLHTNDLNAVDYIELTKLLQQHVSSNKKNNKRSSFCLASSYLQNQKQQQQRQQQQRQQQQQSPYKNRDHPQSPTSPTSTTSTTSTLSTASCSSAAAGPPPRPMQQQQQQQQQRPTSLCLNPLNLPSQFVFKKPLYNQHYHQTHFHHQNPPPSPTHSITPTQSFHSITTTSTSTISKTNSQHQNNKEQQQQSNNNLIFSSWTDLRRFFAAPLTATTAMTEIVDEQLFANQFRQNISSRYGQWGRYIGKGAGGSVRLIEQQRNKKIYAVKQFRKRFAHESEKDYIKKVTAEFCIGSTLHHPNIIETLDLIQENNNFYQIMEYAPNDMFNVVMSGMMSREEIACCWRQLLNGVEYLHSMGIAHRDLKLDNLVLDHMGILKIIDFGCSTVFKYPFDNHIIMTKGVYGSDPYIAPEQYIQPLYDPRLSDVWSCGIIFVCMTIRRFPWRVPRSSDPAFRAFATNHNQQKFRLLKLLPREARSVMTSVLEIDPKRRWSIQTILNDDWVKSIDVCTPTEPGAQHVHHVSVIFDPVVQERRGNLVAMTPEPPGVVAEKEKRKRQSLQLNHHPQQPQQQHQKPLPKD